MKSYVKVNFKGRNDNNNNNDKMIPVPSNFAMNLYVSLLYMIFKSCLTQGILRHNGKRQA